MIKVSYTKSFEKQLNKVPDFIQDKVKSWIWAIQIVGITETQRRPGFHDEPLKGTRRGQRSVRLNKAYRLIYRVIEDRIHIELLEVHKHDY